MNKIEVNELNEFLTCDYVYLPYNNKDELKLRENGVIYKADKVSRYLNKQIYSPVSGRAYGLSQINSESGPRQVLIIENDFKDYNPHKPECIQDIYSLSKDKIKEIVNLNSKKLLLRIFKSSKSDLRDSYLLKDYTKEVLETLNLIDQIYDDVTVKIVLDKRDILSYETLFTYMGTYPNIEVEFNNNKINDAKEITIFDVIDIYNDLKNSVKRDFIYLTIENSRNVYITKVKKYSNLKEVLSFLEIKEENIIINNNKNIKDANFLLDEKIYLINVI